MELPRVFVTRLLPAKGLEAIRAIAEAEVWSLETPPTYQVLAEKTRAAAGLVCLLTDRIDAALLDAGPGLRVVSQMAVGVDNIDLAAATARGVPVGHTPGVLTETTADFAFALLMAAARRIPEGAAYVRTGRWVTWGPTLLMGQDVHGASLGLIGFGRIGQSVARRARGFDMRVVFYDPSVSPEEGRALGAEALSLQEVLSQADFISLHVPLTPDTHHLIGEPELSRMKPSTVLVNTARGPVVDPAALYRALMEGTIAAAALDVTEPEPLPPDHPLLALENCLVVPHIASSSTAARTRMATMAAENLAAGLRGERLPYCANPEVYGESHTARA